MDQSSTCSSRASTARAFFELVRLPNVFTAMADVSMGFLFVRQPEAWNEATPLAFLLAASSLLYMGGVALNDVCDLPRDTLERSWRPLPSGRVSLRAAVWLSGGLLLLGVAWGWAAALLEGAFRPGVIATALAACIFAYDALLKRTPWGPLAMGGCRLLNVLLGMSLVSGGYRAEHWLVAGGIGVYVAGVTWFARNETRRNPRLPLTLAAAVMLGGIGLLAMLPETCDRLIHQLQVFPERWRILMFLLGLIIGYRCLKAVLMPDARHVQAAVVVGILSIVILDAAVCYSVRGPGWGAAIIAMVVPATVLSWWFSPT
jgi:4-hydroxybenzoate polyprenyltransferase